MSTADVEALRATITEEIARQMGALAAPRELGADLTWSALWERYAKTMASRHWWPKMASVIKPALAFFGPLRVLDTKRSDWTTYRDEVALKRTTKQHGPPAPSTLNVELRRLRAAVNWAIQNDILSRNPLQGVKPLKSSRRDTVVSDENLRAVLTALPTWMQSMVLVAMDSGMRVTEIRLLRWDEIDWERSCVHLAANRTKTHKARSPRLSARAVEHLRSLPKTSPYVFANKVGKPYSYTNVWNFWRTAADAAGLKAAAGDNRVRFHDLRRSAITRMIKLGVPLFVAMKAAGHTSAAMTWHYTTVGDEELDDAKRKIDASVGESRP